jgi:hypothetical protein
MTITATKQIKFDDLMKLFKKYVAKSETRPVLQMVYYNNNDNYFYATDSHQLLRVNADYVSDVPAELKENPLCNPKNMEFKNNLNYPEVSRLIPHYSDSTVIIDNSIKEFHQYVKETKKVVKKNRNSVMKLDLKQNGITVSGVNTETEEICSASMDSMHVEGNELTLHINANYIDAACDVIKKLSKVKNEDITLGMTGQYRPIHFNQYGVFDIVILPVRIV